MLCRVKTLSIWLCFLLLSLFLPYSSASALDATIPVSAFEHEVAIRSGCTAYTDVAELNSSEPCSFESTNLGWQKIFLKDVNVTKGYYYQFYIDIYVDSVAGASPTIIVQPLQSLNDNYDVIAFNQVASSEYVGSLVNANGHYGYSYTYSVIVLANETTNNGTIRLGGLGGAGNWLGHLDSGSGNPYPPLRVTLSHLHAYKLLDYSAQLDDIITAINNISITQAGMEQAVENGVENAEENQKEQYEQQAEDNEEDIDDASSAAESTGQSLLSILTQFLGVLTNAQPTNCYLDATLIPHLSIPRLNLCQESPPPAIVALGSLLLIAFVVPLAYHLVKRLLALIGEFQN